MLQGFQLLLLGAKKKTRKIFSFFDPCEFFFHLPRGSGDQLGKDTRSIFSHGKFTHTCLVYIAHTLRIKPVIRFGVRKWFSYGWKWPPKW